MEVAFLVSRLTSQIINAIRLCRQVSFFFDFSSFLVPCSLFLVSRSFIRLSDVRKFKLVVTLLANEGEAKRRKTLTNVRKKGREARKKKLSRVANIPIIAKKYRFFLLLFFFYFFFSCFRCTLPSATYYVVRTYLNARCGSARRGVKPRFSCLDLKFLRFFSRFLRVLTSLSRRGAIKAYLLFITRYRVFYFILFIIFIFIFIFTKHLYQKASPDC